jgi:uncharacterized OB-fold protein
MSEPVTSIQTHVRLPFRYHAGRYTARFLRGIKDDGQLLGVRCTRCRLVLVPPRIACTACWADTGEWVPVASRGVLTTFVVVNVPFYGQKVEIPYVLGHVLLDGADTSIMHLIQEIPIEQVRMGMRVEGNWKPAGEREGSLTDIRYFRPTGEPDVPIERFSDKR